MKDNSSRVGLDGRQASNVLRSQRQAGSMLESRRGQTASAALMDLSLRPTPPFRSSLAG